MPKLPDTIYTAWVLYPQMHGEPEGWANAPDGTEFDEVLNAVLDAGFGEDLPFRIFRMDFDVETNALETTNEVTDDAIEIVRKRCLTRNLELPEWMDAA